MTVPTPIAAPQPQQLGRQCRCHATRAAFRFTWLDLDGFVSVKAIATGQALEQEATEKLQAAVSARQADPCQCRRDYGSA